MYNNYDIPFEPERGAEAHHTCPLLWRLCENECELFFFSPRTEREKLRYSALFSSAKQKDKHRQNSSATQYSSLSVFAALLQFFFI